MTTSDFSFDTARSRDLAVHWEPRIQAWAHLADGDELMPAESVMSAPLFGVPFAVKDVIDVHGQPTRFGSDAFADAEPADDDAAVVAALRHAGAVPLGKTRTTEFAFIDPTVTCNPYDPRRTPGGSSSGSGAVIGAGIVPFALGTQTAGSLCRPATYCGGVSYKPGLGVLPTAGMAPLSASFDAVGVIAQSADWLHRVYGVLAEAFGMVPMTGTSARPLRIGVVDSTDQHPSTAQQAAAVTVAATAQSLGHSVARLPSAVSFTDMIRQHRVVMLAEAAASLWPRLANRCDRLQPLLHAALREGAGISEAQRAAALGAIIDARTTFWHAAEGYDLLLAHPVPGAAPLGLTTTGDQSYLTPWTALGGPLVSLPCGVDPDGLPLGMLLAAAPGRDSFLVETAIALAPHLPVVPRAHF